MQIAVLGTGDVGKAIASGLARHGHGVTMGTRTPDDPSLMEWIGDRPIGTATSADAAEGADLVVLCTSWAGVAPVMKAVREGVAGKVVIDVTNPLRFAGEGPPGLAVGGDDSAGETVQRLAPDGRVVKCWNIVGNPYMIDPDLPETPTMFVAGDDAAAKKDVTALLRQVGWPDVVDVGGIEASRYLEALAMVWIRTYFATGSGAHAFRLVRG